MKKIFFNIAIIIHTFYIVTTIKTINAAEIDGNALRPWRTQATTPTPVEEEITPSPTNIPTSMPSKSPEPSTSPTAVPSVTVTPTAAVTMPITPSVTITPKLTITPVVSITILPTATATPQPESNTGGTDTAIVTTPTPTVTNTPTPTATTTPTPIPVFVGNNQPPAPVKKIADTIFKNVVVPPLSFLFQRPQQDFYQENSISKPTTITLSLLSVLSMIGGIFMTFPNTVAQVFSDQSNRMAVYRSLKLFKTGQV